MIFFVVTTLVVQDALKATKVATTQPISCAPQAAEPKMRVSPESSYYPVKPDTLELPVFFLLTPTAAPLG